MVCVKRDYETEEEARAQQKAVQPLINELTKEQTHIARRNEKIVAES
jgi:hypothetical protein